MSTFDPVASRVAFPELEQGILEFWREHRIFERSVEERPADKIFSFYEGPPTANGNPGIHHVLARAFKDADSDIFGCAVFSGRQRHNPGCRIHG